MEYATPQDRKAMMCGHIRIIEVPKKGAALLESDPEGLLASVGCFLKVDSKAELAKHLGVVRSRVSTILNLLNLDDEIQSFMLSLDDDDKRLKALNERRLRPIALIKKKGIQKERFWNLLVAKML
ncbi:MAG: hypothetical protein O7G87_11335 [bacterium]|nr:hypothetical protein [bacterium]